jgi:hypothetical protein
MQLTGKVITWQIILLTKECTEYLILLFGYDSLQLVIFWGNILVTMKGTDSGKILTDLKIMFLYLAS